MELDMTFEENDSVMELEESNEEVNVGLQEFVGYIDLSGYYTKEQIDAKFKEIDGIDLSDYYTKEQVNDLIDDIEVSGGTSSSAINYDLNVKAINHRGYTTAPENTIPAYIMSKEKGFTYVECDVCITSDGVPVLLHDSTIDRTSDGTGNVYDFTYEQLLQYDFGSWKSSTYKGTKIPTLEEFLKYCKGLGLHPYIEIKSSGFTQEQINNVVDIVEKVGMKGKVTYISFNLTYLGYIKQYDPKARLGYVVSSISDGVITSTLGLKTDDNEVFLDVQYSSVTDENIQLCINNDLPLEVWTVNSQSSIENMNSYISGVTSDSLIAGKILYNKYSTYVAPEVEGDDTGGDNEDGTTPTLTSITATYNGGDVVVGTDIDDLTNITVTATYSDGTSANVTDYTLSGSIVEGSNTITVTYQSLTTTFTVTGYVESGEDEPSEPSDTTLLYNWDFTKSTVDTVSGVEATLSDVTMQNSNGLTFSATNQYVDILGVTALNRTIEVDVASMNITTNQHKRFIINGAHGSTQAFLQYRYNTTPGWSMYQDSWSDPFSDSVAGADNVNVFSGKTLGLYIDNDGYVSLYIDRVFVGKSTVASIISNNNNLSIGSNMCDMTSTVITGMRIYDGLKQNESDSVDNSIPDDSFYEYELDSSNWLVGYVNGSGGVTSGNNSNGEMYYSQFIPIEEGTKVVLGNSNSNWASDWLAVAFYKLPEIGSSLTSRITQTAERDSNGKYQVFTAPANSKYALVSSRNLSTDDYYKTAKIYISGYSVVRTITSDELGLCGCSPLYQASNVSSYGNYTVNNTSRISYWLHDIPVEVGYTYKFEYETALTGSKIGLQFYDQTALDNVASSTDYTDYNVYDPGWQDNGVEIAITEGLTRGGTTPVGVKVTFKNSSGSTMTLGDITKVIISRKKTN